MLEGQAAPAKAFGNRRPRARLKQEVLDRYRRERVVEAIARIAHENGCDELTSTRIVKEARMARGTFYDLFESRTGSLQYAFWRAQEHIFDPVRAAGAGAGPWPSRVSAVLQAFLTTAREKEAMAELCLVHSFADEEGPIGDAYQAGVEAVAAALQGGREAGREALGGDYHDPPPEIEVFLAGSIVSLAALRVRQGATDLLPSHHDELVALVVTPFFGIERALQIAYKPQST